MKWKPLDKGTNHEPGNLNQERSFPAFAPTVSDEFDRLKGLPEEKTISSGVVLLEQGAQPSSVFLLCRGLVKLTSVSPQGRESVLGLRSAGWYAGAVSALAKRPSVYSVRTVTPCVCSRIPAEEFNLWLMRSAKMARHFTKTLCNELMSQSMEAQVMGGSAEERLTHFMRERSTHHPDLQTLDTLPLLKQMELAQLLAITPEHLSRLLRRTAICADATLEVRAPTD